MSVEMPLEPLPIVPDFVVSDLHAHHPNIIRYSNRPENHNRLMVERWNETVDPDSTVLDLGDVALPGGLQRFADEMLPQMPCRRHYLIEGNHDHGLPKMPKHERRAWYERHGFTVIRPFSILYEGWTVTFSHAPSNVWKPREGTDQTAFAREDRWINLYGHTHTHLVDHPRMINVCVENTSYKPVPFAELMTRAVERWRHNDREPIVVSRLMGWTD